MIMGKRVYFIHNSYTWYREPFFIELSRICDIKFFFTKLWKNGYSEIKYDCCKITDLDYEIVNNTFHVAWPVFGHLLKDEYDTVLITVMDNWHQTFEAFVSAMIAKMRGKRVVYFWEKWDKGWLYCEKRNWKTRKVSFFRYLWRIRRFYVKRLELHLLRHLVDCFIPVGTYSKEYILHCGVNEKDISVAHDASEISYEAVKTREQIGMSQDRIVVLFMARVIKLKGCDSLLEAWYKVEKRHSNVDLFICGDGTYMQTMNEKSRQMNLKHIIYTGSIAPENRKDYYANCDIFVLPNWEPDIWGMAVNEAMQFGKPVIVSNLTGCGPDLVKEGENGFIIESGDSQQLYKALEQLILEDSFRRNAGKRSKEIIQEYTYKNMAADFKRALEG